MAGQDPFLNAAPRLLLAMDDDALAALANKGLVRRAKKDLETARPEVLAVEADCVRLRVGEFEVTVPEAPSQAVSTSPAAGIDRYVLAALDFLRDSAPGEKPPAADAIAAARRELAALDDEALQRWAGKAAMRRAPRRSPKARPARSKRRDALIIRIPTRNITCRWLPGGGLESMVCTGPSADARIDGALAVLAWQAAVGLREVCYEETALEASSGAPRSRPEVLSSVGAVLAEMIALGLSRLSKATEQRLRTLAVSAHGVDLPRMERMLRSLADEVRLVSPRRPGFLRESSHAGRSARGAAFSPWRSPILPSSGDIGRSTSWSATCN